FYYVRPHRDLHSFPTRRSSDLDMVIDWAFEGIEAVGRVLRKALDVNLSGCSVPPAAGPRPTCRIPLLDRAMQGNDGRSSMASPIDRKSTRLNSSHVKISYAVFC